VLPPLAVTLRLVPILFYLCALAAAVLSSVTILQIGQANAELMAAQTRELEAGAQLDQTKIERAALEAKANRAGDVLRWVEGSANIQPLAVAIAASLSERAAILELDLSRDTDTDRQVQLALKLQASGGDELETVIEAVRDANFRPFSAQQSQEGNQIAYEATLIRQVGGGGETSE
jgi:hypothetical protein